MLLQSGFHLKYLIIKGNTLIIQLKKDSLSYLTALQGRYQNLNNLSRNYLLIIPIKYWNQDHLIIILSSLMVVSRKIFLYLLYYSSWIWFQIIILNRWINVFMCISLCLWVLEFKSGCTFCLMEHVFSKIILFYIQMKLFV